MRSAPYAEHRAAHAYHLQHGRHATKLPEELKRLAFCATLNRLAGCAVGGVLGLVIGTVLGWGSLQTIALALGLAFVLGHAFTLVLLVRGDMAWGSADRVALAANTASNAIVGSGIEPQAASTPAAPEPDAVASTNASITRPAELSETHPALVELRHNALAARRLAELVLLERLGKVFRKRKRPINEIRVRDRASQQHPALEHSSEKKERLTFQAWQARQTQQELLWLSETKSTSVAKGKVMNVKRVTLITAAIGVALAVAGCKETLPSAAPTKPPGVPVAEVIVRPVTPFVEYTGSLTAVKRVELRPRVAGYIQEVSVPEGRFVEKGRELFRIDPRVFQAAMTAATARLREAEAASLLAQAEHERAEQLFAQKIVARDRLDTATAALNARKAQVDAAKAAVDAAQLELSFTRVTAPISGRVGQALVTEGNYVASGATPLTTIVSINPLHVYFDVDERTYLRSLAAGRASASPEGSQAAKVMVALLTDKTYSRLGRVDFLANAADRGTGTVRMRAVLDNPDGQLTPGLFAKIKLETGAPQARVLVSDQSIGTDQGRRYVLVVGKDNKTEYRPVELGPVVDGLRVIEQGLQPGERLVVKGLVRPGMHVTPQSAAIDGAPIAMPQTSGVAP